MLTLSMMLSAMSCGSRNPNVSDSSDATASFAPPQNTAVPSAGPSSAQSDTGNSYMVSKTNYSNRNISVSYPQVTRMTDTSKQDVINDILKTQALKVLTWFDEDPSNDVLDIDYDKLTLDVDCSITWQGPNLLSVTYGGLGAVSGAAQPTKLFYSTNIDMFHARKVRLTDAVNLYDDDNYISNRLFLGDFDVYFAQISKYEIMNSANIKSNLELEHDLSNADSMDYIGTDKQTGIFSFFTKDSLCFSFPVGHAGGGHADAALKISDIAPVMSADTHIWYDYPGELAGLIFNANDINLKDLPDTIDDFVFYYPGHVYLFSALSEDNIYLYGYFAPDNNVSCSILRMNNMLYYFDWLYITPRRILPKLHFADFDKDGQNELAIVLYVGSGSGLSVEMLRMIEFGADGTFTDSELPPDDYVQYLENNLSYSIDTDDNVIMKAKNSTLNCGKIETAADWKFTGLGSPGDNVSFLIEGDKIRCIILVGLNYENCATTLFAGQAVIDVSYKDRRFEFGDIVLKPFDN